MLIGQSEAAWKQPAIFYDNGGKIIMDSGHHRAGHSMGRRELENRCRIYYPAQELAYHGMSTRSTTPVKVHSKTSKANGYLLAQHWERCVLVFQRHGSHGAPQLPRLVVVVVVCRPRKASSQVVPTPLDLREANLAKLYFDFPRFWQDGLGKGHVPGVRVGSEGGLIVFWMFISGHVD